VNLRLYPVCLAIAFAVVPIGFSTTTEKEPLEPLIALWTVTCGEGTTGWKPFGYGSVVSWGFRYMSKLYFWATSGITRLPFP